MEMYNNMVLLQAQAEVTNTIGLLQLISTISLAVILGLWALFKGGVESKDESQEKDLIILRKDFDAKINKERGSREKLEIEIANKQNTINKELKDLIHTVYNGQIKSDERWDEFKGYQQRWEDATNDKVQQTMLDVSAIKGKLNEIDSKIESESKNIKTMAEKSIIELNEAKETYHKASEKTTQ